ncbi:TspO/MBR family protein [Streptomyces sp. NPDC006173]|uniref:TspO/MBR family protein n=1 Tax=Streptomyces sp. NPDC006173 TaxID=3155349 RepID=UPI00340D6013
MRLISEGRASDSRTTRWRQYTGAGVAVAAAAVAGSVAVDPGSDWYRRLNKPTWQPPSWAFGAVWTPLYASLAFAGGHALNRAQGRDRVKLAAGFGTNLILNAGWNWLFFRAHSPRAGVGGTLLLDVSNADLIRRLGRVDPKATYTLLPYAAWCAFATILNTSIARRNPR